MKGVIITISLICSLNGITQKLTLGNLLYIHNLENPQTVWNYLQPAGYSFISSTEIAPNVKQYSFAYNYYKGYASAWVQYTPSVAVVYLTFRESNLSSILKELKGYSTGSEFVNTAIVYYYLYYGINIAVTFDKTNSTYTVGIGVSK